MSFERAISMPEAGRTIEQEADWLVRETSAITPAERATAHEFVDKIAAEEDEVAKQALFIELTDFLAGLSAAMPETDIAPAKVETMEEKEEVEAVASAASSEPLVLTEDRRVEGETEVEESSESSADVPVSAAMTEVIAMGERKDLTSSEVQQVRRAYEQLVQSGSELDVRKFERWLEVFVSSNGRPTLEPEHALREASELSNEVRQAEGMNERDISTMKALFEQFEEEVFTERPTGDADMRAQALWHGGVLMQLDTMRVLHDNFLASVQPEAVESEPADATTEEGSVAVESETVTPEVETPASLESDYSDASFTGVVETAAAAKPDSLRASRATYVAPNPNIKPVTVAEDYRLQKVKKPKKKNWLARIFGG